MRFIMDGVTWLKTYLNVDKAGMCPLEKLATEISNSGEAYEKLKALQNFLMHGKVNKMSGEHERFISEEDEELRRIREKKLRELMRLREKKQEMSVKPVHVTDSNFNEIINKHSLALIDCWASWCAPCVVIAPIIEEVAKEYAGKVLVGKLNVDENLRTAERFQVFSIPTLLIMKNGEEVDRIVGLVPKSYVRARLEKYLR